MCVFQVSHSRKSTAPVKSAKWKHPYLIYSICSHTYNYLLAHFRAALGTSSQQQDAIYSLQQRRDQDSFVEGGVADLGAIELCVYRQQNADFRMDLNERGCIYKFYFYGWQLPTSLGQFGSCQGQQSVPPKPPLASFTDPTDAPIP